MAAPSAPTIVIDAHCHTFNASDLSVVGFLSEVVVDSDEKIPLHLIDPLVRLAARAIGRAPGADEEISHLAELHAATVARRQTAVQQAHTDARAERDFEYRRNVEREIERIAVSSNANERALYEEMLRHAAIDRSALAMVEGAAPTGPAVARGLSLSPSAIGRFIRWAGRLRHFRADIISEIIQTYGSRPSGVSLFVSAMVDFAHWLGDEPSTSPASQVPLGGRLSRAFPGRIHFFAPFDPWREADNPDTPQGSLYWAKQAIEHQGFLGVKLYPPMGFAAAGNPGLDFSAVGQASSKQFGGRLDDALDRLFAWALAEDVPIMAHCNLSEESKLHYAERASPAYWGAALEKFPGLRLNLAHFGGQENLGHASTTAPGGDWPARIMEMMSAPAGSRLYTDVGNFDLHDEDVRTAWLAQLKAALQQTPTLATRLMYGSDWMMLALSDGAEGFLTQFRAGLAGIVGPAGLVGVLGGNARDFLGLNPGEKTRGRLEGFYDSNGLARPVWLQGGG